MTFAEIEETLERAGAEIAAARGLVKWPAALTMSAAAIADLRTARVPWACIAAAINSARSPTAAWTPIGECQLADAYVRAGRLKKPATSIEAYQRPAGRGAQPPSQTLPPESRRRIEIATTTKMTAISDATPDMDAILNKVRKDT